MRRILIAGHSEEAIRRGASAAADLSVACGARLSLARVSPGITSAASAHDGQMSDLLFRAPDWRKPLPSFAVQAVRPDWLRDLRGIVDEDWGEITPNRLPAFMQRIDRESPSLVITSESGLARVLIDETKAPIWHVRTGQAEPEWLSLRRLRCNAHGLRAVEWARNLAASLGAELDFDTSGRDPDVAVLTRGLRATLRGLVPTRSMQPLVMV